jgi:hypothetical protein
MKKVYICHPFSGDPEVNRKRVDKICNRIVENEKGVLPISPIHSFSFVKKETPELREAIMSECLKRIKELSLEKCDKEIRVYLYDQHQSKGQSKEVDYALNLPINIKYINGDLI